MLQLKQTHDAPPGNWRYEIPETGDIIQSLSWNGLLTVVKNYYTSRQLPLPADLANKMQDWMCDRQPPGSTACEEINADTKAANMTHNFTVTDVISFLNSVKHTIQAGGVVPQEEANRRANICNTCPYNKTVSGCFGCKNVAKVVFEVIGAKTTPYNQNLKQCTVCGCYLSAKVWIAREALMKNPQIQANASRYPSNCWQIWMNS